MPILRMKDIRSMPSEERKEKIIELRTELARLRTMVKAGGLLTTPLGYENFVKRSPAFSPLKPKKDKRRRRNDEGHASHSSTRTHWTQRKGC